MNMEVKTSYFMSTKNNIKRKFDILSKLLPTIFFLIIAYFASFYIAIFLLIPNLCIQSINHKKYPISVSGLIAHFLPSFSLL